MITKNRTMRRAKYLFTQRSGEELSPCAVDLWPCGCWTGPLDWFCYPWVLSIVNSSKLKISSLQNWFALQVRTWTCNLWKASMVWAESHINFLMEVVQKIQEKCLSRTLRFLSQLGKCQDRVNWGCSGLAHTSFTPEMFWFWIKTDGFGQTERGWIPQLLLKEKKE